MTSQKIGQRINSALANNKMKQKDLAKILGVTDNTISYYCSGKRTPKVGQIALIAQALNVTTDYLLGLTSDPNRQTSAVDELGISPKSVEWIKIFAKNNTECFDHDDTAIVFNSLLEDKSFTVFFYELCSFFYAKRAEYIYASLFSQAFSGEDDGYCVISRDKVVNFNQKIENALKDTAFPDVIPDYAKREDYLPHEIADYLHAILELEDSEPGDSDFIDALTGLFGLRVSELPELRARKAFDGIMRTLDRNAEIEGELVNIPKCLADAMRCNKGCDQ